LQTKVNPFNVLNSLTGTQQAANRTVSSIINSMQNNIKLCCKEKLEESKSKLV